MNISIDDVISDLDNVRGARLSGRVTAVQGLLAEVEGISHYIGLGGRVHLCSRSGHVLRGEVVGSRGDVSLIMPFGDLDDVGTGCLVTLAEEERFICPDPSWLGRIIDALGIPIDSQEPLKAGKVPYHIRQRPPQAHKRRRVGDKLDIGVRAVNCFATTCRGQRMGVFAGSGVGKSVLLSMFARNTEAEVVVIGLVGERGREVREFLEDHLGAEGLARSVVVVATSDEPALMRRQAAHMALTIAEFFRDQGHQVLCLIDSVTRFAMAMREIGLSAGEPPASKGYTPSVFAELPRLLERAGPGVSDGSITGLFTVLVEGDDFNEPVTDTVRGILDGHIILDRAIADRGRYPAMNVLRSISRMMPACNSESENALVEQARSLLASYDEMADLIRIGAYRKGSDAKIDEAIRVFPLLENMLRQSPDEVADFEEGYHRLAEIMSI